MTDRFTDNTGESRFELHVDGLLAVADYHRRDGVLTLPHVEADIPLRGTGAAGRLMEVEGWLLPQSVALLAALAARS